MGKIEQLGGIAYAQMKSLRQEQRGLPRRGPAAGLNRLNVAVSRARCFAVVLASPKLLDVQCRTPELMRALNACCQLLESSRGLRPDLRGTVPP